MPNLTKLQIKIIRALFNRELTQKEIIKETESNKTSISLALKELEKHQYIEKNGNGRYNKKYKIRKGKYGFILQKQLIPFTIYIKYRMKLSFLLSECTGSHIDNDNDLKNNLYVFFIPEILKMLGELHLLKIYSKENVDSINEIIDYLYTEIKELIPELEHTYNIDLGKKYLCEKHNNGDFNEITDTFKGIDFNHAKEILTLSFKADLDTYMKTKQYDINKALQILDKKYEQLGFPFNNYWYEIRKGKKDISDIF